VNVQFVPPLQWVNGQSALKTAVLAKWSDTKCVLTRMVKFFPPNMVNMKLLNVEHQSHTLLNLEAALLLQLAMVPQLNVDLVLDKSLREHSIQMLNNVNHFWTHLQLFQVNHVKQVSHVHTGQPGPKSTILNVTKNQHVSHLSHDSEHAKVHQKNAVVTVPISKRSPAWQMSHSDHMEQRSQQSPPIVQEDAMDKHTPKPKTSSVLIQSSKLASNVHPSKNQSVNGEHGTDNAHNAIPISSLDKNSTSVTMPLLKLIHKDACHKSQWYHGVNGMLVNVPHVADKWSDDESTHVHHYGLLKNNSLLAKPNQLSNLVNGQSAHVTAGRIHLL